MIVHVRAVRKDLLQGIEEVFADGNAIRKGNSFSVRECPPWTGIDIVTAGETEAVLEHRGETESRIVLPFEGDGRAEVKSEFGTMVFRAVLDEFSQSEEEIMIRYRLFQKEELIAHTVLCFFFQESEKGFHA